MKKLNHVKAGDPITAELYNAVAERLERFLNLRSGSPYVRIWETPTGKAIALALPEPTYALLSGSTSPYSFTEVRDGPGGTWVSMPQGDSGVANCYEVNGKAGLGGKVVPIEWTSARDWRFQWVGYGPACGLTVSVNGCLGFGVPGATVELSQSGTLIDSCVTDGRVFSVVRYNGGTGGTDGSYTNGSFTGGGGSGATFNYVVSGGVVQGTFTVTNPGSGYTSVPQPVFPAGGTGIVAGATLSSSCRLTPPSAGTYDLTITPPPGTGFDAYAGTVNFSCSGSTDVVALITLTPDSDHVCTIMCNYPIPKTVYTTDGLGLHPLVLASYDAGARTGAWEQTTSFGAEAYDLNDTTGACSLGGSTVAVRYRLECLNFLGIPAWFLSISWSAYCCADGSYKYGTGLPGTASVNARVNASTACFPLDLAFNIPTQDTASCGFLTLHLPTPGGGGVLEVTP